MVSLEVAARYWLGCSHWKLPLQLRDALPVMLLQSWYIGAGYYQEASSPLHVGLSIRLLHCYHIMMGFPH